MNHGLHDLVTTFVSTLPCAMCYTLRTLLGIRKREYRVSHPSYRTASCYQSVTVREIRLEPQRKALVFAAKDAPHNLVLDVIVSSIRLSSIWPSVGMNERLREGVYMESDRVCWTNSPRCRSMNQCHLPGWSVHG
jgi:hypothetical protein